MTTEKKAPSHPPYLQMIGEAIGALKERTGSSQYAITKFVEEKHKIHLPPNFKKLILVQLRKLTASGKLTKVKNSYKLPSSAPAKPKPADEAKPKPKAKTAAAKPKPTTAGKPKAPKAPVKPAKKAAKPAAKPGVKKAAQSPAKVKKVLPVKPKSVKRTPVKKSAPAKKMAKK